MTLDTIAAYYQGLQWGSHINLFSVLNCYTNGEEMGGQELRKRFFFAGSPMGVGPAPADVTQRTIGALRLRQMLYHVIKAKQMGLMQHVPGTHGKATRYVITSDGQKFVAAGMRERASYLRQHSSHSVDQACTHAESKRLSALKHFSRIIKHRHEDEAAIPAQPINACALILQRAWGINPPPTPSSAPALTHKIAVAADIPPRMSTKKSAPLEFV